MKNLNGKVVWLTGASSGIGEALAYALAAEGARLILSARREEELKRVGDEVKARGADYLILPLDLAEQKDFEAKKQAVLTRFDRIDVLINNGGISQRSLAKDTPVEVDRKIFEVNFFGTIALTKMLLPLFIAQKDGMIVTITSAVGKFGSPWRSGYSASKHALHGFFDSLRAEVHDENVKVLLVCPGFIQTNVSINALTATGEKLGSMDTATAKGLTAEECARQIVKAIKTGKEEVFISGFLERLALYVKRFFPGLFSMMITKMKVR
jgi:dehydrogenase/reductase SDR family protein 7B